ncbi:MAG: hypothetical protein AAF738_05020 [Bacteroidota bacterium]
MSEERRKLLRPYEWILLAFVLVLMIHFGLQSLGFNMAGRSSDAKWLAQPNAPSEMRRPSSYQRAEERKLDATLEQIAQQFAAGDKYKAKPRDFQPQGLSQDETKYYRDLQQRQAQKGLSAKDWAIIINTSYATYKTVRTIFDEADGNSGEQVDESELNKILSDTETRSRAFLLIERELGVPAKKLEAFASRGSRALSDWATFVDQNKAAK